MALLFPRVRSSFRTFLALLLLVPSGLALTGSDSSRGEEPRAVGETFGAEPNPTGSPIGGGKGYEKIVREWDLEVSTKSSLLKALGKARRGDVIYVSDDARIDLTGHHSISIPAGVTLASGRGRDGSEGALLFTTEDRATPRGKSELLSLFKTAGKNVRVTGLRLRGPDPDRRGSYAFINFDGILSDHAGLEVDNCELWGWSHGAVYLRRGSAAHIHHNSIHHCQRSGLGYGVVLDIAEALIEANIFDWCRHAIAGTGRPGSGYEARYNLVLENASSHSFDMHGGRDRRDGTHIAGDWIKIHHNTFRAAGVYAVVIRGKPRQVSEIHHNWFPVRGTVRAVSQKNQRGNLRIYRNLFSDRE